MTLPLYSQSNNNNDSKFGKLVRYQSLPIYLQTNPWIKSGYRSSYTEIECVKSIFQLSNETINIWSHLFGLILFVVLLFYDNLITLRKHNGSIMDHVIMTIGTLSFIVCMLASVCYHIFLCHSEPINRFWLSIDLFGICLGLLGCYIPGIYLAFYCFPFWMLFYTLLIICMCGSVAMLQLHPRYKSHENFKIRILIYICLAIFGVVPTFHWVYLNVGVRDELIEKFTIKVIRLYFFAGVSFFIYYFKIPERILPGKFDYLGSSHQLWHLLTLFCFYDWRTSGLEYLYFMSTRKCQ